MTAGIVASKDDFQHLLSRTTNVECPHRQLCSRFTNRLGGHNTNSFADVNLGTSRAKSRP